MQVSWIDPNEIRDLLEQIEGPPPKPSVIPSEWAVHNLGLAPAPEAPSILSTPAVAERPAPAPEPEEQAPVPDHRPPMGMDLERIRERLRTLREQARGAGMLARLETPSTTPAAAGGGAPTTPPVLPTLPALPPSVAPEIVRPAQFESRLPASPVVPPQHAIASEAPVAPVPAVPAVAAPPPFSVPALGLSDRLNAFALWARELLKTAEVLLVDDYGDVLWGGHAQTPLALSAMMAWQAAQRSSAESVCNELHRIDKELASDRALTVLSVRTRYGAVSFAAIQQQPMAEADEAAIRSALVLAIEGQP